MRDMLSPPWGSFFFVAARIARRAAPWGRVVTRPAKADNVVRYRTTELRRMELESPAWTLVPPLRLTWMAR
jgi:hypothetical protein